MKTRKELLKDKVVEIKATNHKTIAKVLEEMALTGFQGRTLGRVFEIWKKMCKEEDMTIILGLSGSLATAGQSALICQMIDQGFVDMIVSTGAQLSEDIIPAIGLSYYRGSQNQNDKELLDNSLMRYYDVYGTQEDYTVMEELIYDFIMSKVIGDKPISSIEFLNRFGEFLTKKNINSIVAHAYQKNVPVCCPAIADSAYGDAYLMALNSGQRLVIDQMKDFEQLMRISEKSKNTAVIYLGGGVPKDVIQLMAASLTFISGNKNIPDKHGGLIKSTKEWYYPHKYAIQITTANPMDGGLSGCTLEEAISWGKVEDAGNHVCCYSDITIALPLLIQGLFESIGERKNRMNVIEKLGKKFADNIKVEHINCD